MKRKLIMILALSAALIMLTACGNTNENSQVELDNNLTITESTYADETEAETSVSEQETIDIDSVIMELISVDNISAKVKICNNLEKEIDVEGNFEIQIQTDDGWSDLPYINDDFGGFLGHANPIGSGCSQEFNVMWEDYYGKLAAGRYRITNFFLLADKNGNYAFSEKYYLYSEFEIIDENVAS